MKLDEFTQGLSEGAPPGGMGELLEALWFEARGHWRASDWDRAHRIVQDLSSADAARVHAYLHRREGDLANAQYWYGRAGVTARQDCLEAEWRDLVQELLGRHD